MDLPRYWEFREVDVRITAGRTPDVVVTTISRRVQLLAKVLNIWDLEFCRITSHYLYFGKCKDIITIS
jgi:hypothetical protein